jgi:anti-sigma regulatory factor (Ser/Thr protein kinase)
MSGGTGTVTGCVIPRDDPGRRSGAGAACQVSFLEFAPLPMAVACARLHAGAVLHEWGLREVMDDVAVIVSELMTNAQRASAVLDSRPPVALRLVADGERLVIEAWDHSPLDVASASPDEDAEYGRGLVIVEALSDRWGLERVARNHKVVWAEMKIPGRCAG